MYYGISISNVSLPYYFLKTDFWFSLRMYLYCLCGHLYIVDAKFWICLFLFLINKKFEEKKNKK